MAAPIKRVSDTPYTLNQGTLADLNPHITALTTGQFYLGTDAPASPTDNDAFVSEYGPDGGYFGSVTLSASSTSNETAQSGYGLSNGNIVFVWTDAPTSSDIKALLLNPDIGGTSPFL